MLLFGGTGDAPPDAAVRLEPTLPSIPLTGDAVVHGPVEEGERVVFEVGTEVVYAASRVPAWDADEVLGAVNGVLYVGEDEDDW
jgi:hypothetical protein